MMTISKIIFQVIYLKVFQTIIKMKKKVLILIFLERNRFYVYKHFESCEMVIVNCFCLHAWTLTVILESNSWYF